MHLTYDSARHWLEDEKLNKAAAEAHEWINDRCDKYLENLKPKPLEVFALHFGEHPYHYMGMVAQQNLDPGQNALISQQYLNAALGQQTSNSIPLSAILGGAVAGIFGQAIIETRHDLV